MNIGKHISKDRVFINNILITIVIGVVVNFLNYLFNIFLARNLDSTDFGIYNAAIGIITLVQIPAIAIQTAITKKVANNKKYNLKKFKLNSTLQLTGIAIVISILFFLFGDLIAEISNISKVYILPLTLVVFVSIVNPLAKGFLLGIERILSFNMVLLLETLLKFFIGYLALYWTTDIQVIILAFALPQILSIMFILPLVKTGGKEQPTKQLKLNYKHISLIFTTFLLLNAPFTIDLILVNPDVRASYGALALVGKIVYFGSITIASLMISKLANSQKRLRRKTLVISLIVSGLTGIAISLLYLIFSKDIVQIVFDGMYIEIVSYIVPYAIAMTAYALSYMVITSLLVEDSYIHIYFLIFLSVLQVVLFRINNESLYDAFLNQIIIYGILSIFIFFILIFYIFNNNGKISKRKT